MAAAGSVVVNMIANTASFRKGMEDAGKSIKQVQGDLTQLRKQTNAVGRAFNAFAVIAGAKFLADGIKEIHRAMREGENAAYALAASLPVLGSVAKSFNELFNEVGGLNQQLILLKGLMDINTGIGQIAQSREKLSPLQKELKLIGDLERQYKELIETDRRAHEQSNKWKEVGFFSTLIASVDLLGPWVMAAAAFKGKEIKEKLFPDYEAPNMTKFDVLRRQAEEYWKQIEKVKTGEKELAQQRIKDAQIQSGMDYFTDRLKSLQEEVAGVDQMTIALNRMAERLGFTTEQYNAMLEVITKINELQGVIDAKNKKPESVTPPSVLTPSAREIDTSLVSVAGLAMSGKDTQLSELKKHTVILQSIDRQSRRTGQEVLN